MNNLKYVYKNLPISQVHQDNDQPRKDLDEDAARAKLRDSIEMYGISVPIAVCQTTSEDKYRIIDGHRRYLSARDLGIEIIPCIVYEKMPEGELESRRYEIQNNKKAWLPIEKSNALNRIKGLLGFKTNRELANYLHVSESPVANCLQLREESMSHLELMAKHKFSQSYMTEFVRLKPKIRKIKEFEPSEIIRKIFTKVDSQVIKTSRDFRKLGRVFLRAAANENALYDFIKDDDMTVEELTDMTVQSGFSKLIEDLTQEIMLRLDEHEKFDPQEEDSLKDLSKLINKIIGK